MKLFSIFPIAFIVILLTAGGKNVKKAVKDDKCKVVTLMCKKSGNFPNSSLPVVIYKTVYKAIDPKAVIADMKTKSWYNFWQNGVYSFHHYHSTAHEVLACYSGSAKVQFGGPDGKTVEFEKGDVVIIPAGVAHKKIASKDNFAVLGGYPKGQCVNMKYGKAEEVETAQSQIQNTAQPKEDPVFGKSGKLGELWGFKKK